MEKFVEENMVAELRIARELGVRFHRGTLAVLAPEKKFREALRDFICCAVKRDKFS